MALLSLIIFPGVRVVIWGRETVVELPAPSRAEMVRSQMSEVGKFNVAWEFLTGKERD